MYRQSQDASLSWSDTAVAAVVVARKAIDDTNLVENPKHDIYTGIMEDASGGAVGAVLQQL